MALPADFFCQELKNNVQFLSEFVEVEPNHILEVGCYQGESTQVWLQEFLTDNGTIVCIDPFNVSDEDPFGTSDPHSDSDSVQQFWHNVDQVKKPGQNIELRLGRSYHELAGLISEQQKFDLIYIDGNHTAAAVMADACMAFGMLNKGGIMLFDDFFWHDTVGVNGQSLSTLDWPKMAIDAFTTLYHNHLEILFINYQYAIRKW
jgi:predicted O-methyltransferase YrrM